MRNSASPASCHPLLFRYMLNPFFFFSFSLTLFVMASNGGKLQQEEVVASGPINPPHLPWTVYAYGLDGIVRERALPCNPNVMGNLFPPNTQVVGPSLPLFFCYLSFFSITNPSFFELQPTIQEHEELVWLAGNLKQEVTNYLRSLYGLGGAAYSGGGDDDDGGGGDEEDLGATPSYQPRKRRHH